MQKEVDEAVLTFAGRIRISILMNNHNEEKHVSITERIVSDLPESYTSASLLVMCTST